MLKENELFHKKLVENESELLKIKDSTSEYPYSPIMLSS